MDEIDMSLAGVDFLKMNGLGNDFVIVDLRNRQVTFTAEDIARLADRKKGVGCDQFITIEKGPYMGVWNSDGSPAGACGNAARCVISLLLNETGAAKITLETPSGSIEGWRAGDTRISVDMGEPKISWRQIPLAEQMDDTRFIDIKLGPIDAPVLWGPSAVNMGNPHCIFFVEDAEAQALDRFGPMIEHHPLFPEQANVSVAEVKGGDIIRLRVWERGVGVTKACGTAACAAAVAAHRRRLTGRKTTVVMDGGPLQIEWRDDNHVIMTGPVELEFTGTL